jgi:hypothetical protein
MRVLFGSLVLVASVLLGGAPAAAQGLNWGVKGGVNFATLSVDEEPKPEFQYRIGLIAGGFVTWPMASHLDVQPEALFSQQGATFDALGAGSTIKTDYLVIPILVRYKLNSSGRGLVLFAGPSLAFKLSANATADFGGGSVTDDISDEIESFDYGLVFGGGWEAGRLSIDGRYTWGLSRINVDGADPQKTMHRVIAVLAGVRF